MAIALNEKMYTREMAWLHCAARVWQNEVCAKTTEQTDIAKDQWSATENWKDFKQSNRKLSEVQKSTNRHSKERIKNCANGPGVARATQRIPQGRCSLKLRCTF